MTTTTQPLRRTQSPRKQRPCANKLGGGIRKGSENALSVGIGGDAHYMELSGTSITAGLAFFQQQRAQALEVAQCVIPDPNVIAAAGTSSVALKMVYAPMLGKVTMLRTQYGAAIERILEQMIASAKRVYATTTEVEVDEEGNEIATEVMLSLDLPPRVVREPVYDDDGNPTGEETIALEYLEPGEGGDLEIVWGDFFAPTANDKLQAVQSVASATAGKAVLSQRGGAGIVSELFGLDAATEIAAIEAAERAKADAEQAMFMGAQPVVPLQPTEQPSESV